MTEMAQKRRLVCRDESETDAVLDLWYSVPMINTNHQISKTKHSDQDVSEMHRM